jgi:TonB-linked SusC/RagA family outer membrane protein
MENFSKILNIMRISTLFLFICVFATFAGNTWSQNAIVNIREANMTIAEFIDQVENQTDYLFVYSKNELNTKEKTSLKTGSKTVAQCLSETFGNTGIKYVFENEYIVLTTKDISITQQSKKQIRGTVTDEQGEPIIGANVIEKGVAFNGSITDADGNFSLAVAENAVLQVSFIGYITQEINVLPQLINGNNLIISMIEDMQALDEVVVVGYGTVKKRDLTGSVASVSAAKILAGSVTNAMQALQGNVPGVLVTTTNWSPGSTPSVLIRGKRSIKASNDPLYVVDGIPVTGGMGDLPPNEIESIDVLKDASATAIYGARGSNGVILITTKRGKTGKVQVSYNGYAGAQTILNKIELMNGAEYAEYVRESYRGAGKYASDVPNKDLDYTIPTSFGGSVTGLSGPAVDAYTWESIAMAYDENGNYDPSKVRSGALWWKEVERTGIVTDHQLSIRGGRDSHNYMLGITYYKNEGIYKDDSYERYSIRLNNETEAAEWLKIGVSTQFTHSLLNDGVSMENNWRVNPLGRLWDDDGNLTECTSGTDTQWWNPLQYLAEAAVISPKKVNRYFGSYYGEIKLPLDGLRFRTNVGLDFISTQDYSFASSKARSNNANQANNATAQRYMYTVENLLFYDKTFNQHSLGVTLLQSVQRDINESNNIVVQELPSDDIKYYDVASGLTVSALNSDHQEWSMASYMGRLNYNFKQRYYATVSMRYDGASRLAAGYKWVAFPAAALAWRINEESFLRDIRSIDNLKLRLGYGVSANSAISPYQTKGQLSKAYYNFGDNHVIGYAPGGLPNKALTWETTEQWNIGLDFGLLNNRINGTIDLYRQSTIDLLLDRQLPAVSGFTSVASNVGKTANKGVEISLSTVNISTRNFEWITDWMFSFNKEEIVELYNGKVDDIGNSWFIGKPVNVFYDYKKVGIWQNTPEDLAEMQKFNDNGHKFTVGSIKIQDVDSDYKITADKDRMIIGQSRPKQFISLDNTFRYKNFDLDIFLYGAFGGMIKNEIRYNHQSYRNNNMKYDYWTMNNPTNAFPRPNADINNIDYESTLYYEKSDFLRVKTVTFGYTLPKQLLENIKLSSARIYVTAQNPLIWTKYSGVDPEGAASGVSAASGYASPSVSNWIVGINLNF